MIDKVTDNTESTIPMAEINRLTMIESDKQLSTEAFTYTVKVWLTISVLSPVLTHLFNILQARKLSEVVDFFEMIIGLPFVVLLVGIAIIPSATILFLVCSFLLKKNVKPLSNKIMLSILGLLLTCASISVVGDFQFNWDFLVTILPYCLSVIASIWLYKFELTT